MEVLHAALWQCDLSADYNIADSLVAGKFIGEEALAAVGNSNEITLIFHRSVSAGDPGLSAFPDGARLHGDLAGLAGGLDDRLRAFRSVLPPRRLH